MHTPLLRDMADMPTYASRFTGGNGIITLNPKRPAKGNVACVGFPKYLGGAVDASALLDAARATGRGLDQVFCSAPSFSGRIRDTDCDRRSRDSR